MFVTLKKTMTMAILAGTTFFVSASAAYGNEEDVGNLKVNLVGLQAGGGPLYVSVQKREDFMQERGTSGGIYKNITGGDISYEYAGIPTGDYSVMIWHDIDNDGEFSMDERFMPLDGWGASGPDLKGAPAFDDVKIVIDKNGTELTIQMHYPHA